MKDYKSYMDRVKVSDTLHARLTALESEKRPSPRPVWKKYGTIAAALVLVVGLAGYFGLTYGWDGGVLAKIGGEDGPTVSMQAIAKGDAEAVASENAIDIAPEYGVSVNGGMQTMGGYEIHKGEVVQYFMLPYIAYGEVNYEVEADWAPPVGVVRRDVNEKEMLALWKHGEQVLTNHLDWGGYEVAAHAMVHEEDNSLWCLWVHGTASDTEHFTLTVMPGAQPPSCIIYPESEVNNLWDVEVSASGMDGKFGSTRRISFMKDDIGYSFEIVGEANEKLYERVSRLARWIIIEGLDLSAFGMVEDEILVGDAPVSIPNANGDGYSTPAYDPAAKSSISPSMPPKATTPIN